MYGDSQTEFRGKERTVPAVIYRTERENAGISVGKVV